MKKILFSFCFLLLFLISNNLISQVTIGSDQTPNKGALLDFKENIPDPNGVGITSTRGLAMPRVSLGSYSALTMGDNKIEDINNSWQAHTGLIVYNTGEEYDKCNIDTPAAGLHIWNGKKWIPIGPKKRDYEPMTAAPGPSAIYAPNCYMYNNIGASGNVIIPVAKAFDIWDWWGGKSFNGQKSDRRYLTETSDAFTGSLSVSVVWEEGMGTTAAIDDDIVGTPTLDKTTLDRTARITVPVTGKKGNAVIALSDSKGIRWSWHIWVTDNPTTTAYTYDTGNQINTWMDRNIGATSATPQSAGAAGLLYQWGRKDPFPGYKFIGDDLLDVEKTKTTNITVQINSLPNVQSADGDGNLTSLAKAISNPLMFISSDNDWFSSTGSDWDVRWGYVVDECNTIFQYRSEMDPCPEGWRIPGFSGGDMDLDSPWTKKFDPNEELPEEESEMWKYWTDEPWNNGWNFNREDYKMGWYPATGFRRWDTGEFTPPSDAHRNSGYFWSITPNFINNTVEAFYMAFTETWAVGILENNKAYGFAVRCVKDNK